MAKIATPKQVKFILKLADERVMPADVADRAVKICMIHESGDTPLPASKASSMIDWMLSRPKKATAPVTAPHQGKPAAPGVYLLDGTVYVVKLNKAKTNSYAKRLIDHGDDFTLTYAPSVVYQLTEDHRMTLEDAQTLMAQYGRCLCCHRQLKHTAKATAKIGIAVGPVCIKQFKITSPYAA